MKSLLHSSPYALFLTSLVVTATPRMPASTQQNVDGYSSACTLPASSPAPPSTTLPAPPKPSSQSLLRPCNPILKPWCPPLWCNLQPQPCCNPLPCVNPCVSPCSDCQVWSSWQYPWPTGNCWDQLQDSCCGGCENPCCSQGLGYCPDQPSVISQSVCWSPTKKTAPMKLAKSDMPMMGHVGRGEHGGHGSGKDESPMSPMKVEDNYDFDCKLCRLLELMKAMTKHGDGDDIVSSVKPKMSHMKRVRYYDYDDDVSGIDNSEEKYVRPIKQPNRYRTGRLKYKSYNDNSEEESDESSHYTEPQVEWNRKTKESDRMRKWAKELARLRKYDWGTSDSVESSDTLVIPQSYSDRRRKRYQR